MNKILADKRKYLIVSIITVCLVSLLYTIYSQFIVSTDNAYVNANVVQIAPRVTGQVNYLAVKNNQYVKQGDLLFSLDKATFDATLNQQKAQLSINHAKLRIAQLTEQRTAELSVKKAASQQQEDIAKTNLQAASAEMELAQANLKQSELNLSYSNVYAPTSGWVSNLSLRVGDVVPANQPVFALIGDNEFWIDANFKETELQQIHPGQQAKIKVDMYPNIKFHGVVDSISGGSGSVFSLLPPQNATGNWVKVTQRVPVRIRVTDVNRKFPLRIGTSVNVSIRVNPWSSGG